MQIFRSRILTPDKVIFPDSIVQILLNNETIIYLDETRNQHIVSLLWSPFGKKSFVTDENTNLKDCKNNFIFENDKIEYDGRTGVVKRHRSGKYYIKWDDLEAEQDENTLSSLYEINYLCKITGYASWKERSI